MSDSGNNSYAFDENALKQALNESLDRPADSGQEKSAQKNSNNGISWIVMAVILLSAAAFTASGWMTNQKIAALKIQIENLEIQMNNNRNAEADQVLHENIQQAISSGQKREAMLMQQAAQLIENREELESLKQLVADTVAQNKINSAIMASIPPAISSEDPIAKAVSPTTEQAEVADTVAVRKISAKTESSAATKQEMAIPEAARPEDSKKNQGWNVILISLKNEATADRELAALLKQGQQAEKHSVEVHGETFYQLRTGRFEREDDARAHLKTVIRNLGYKDAWIRHMQ